MSSATSASSAWRGFRTATSTTCGVAGRTGVPGARFGGPGGRYRRSASGARPRPEGRPGFVRVNTVHSGDRDGETVKLIEYSLHGSTIQCENPAKSLATNGLLCQEARIRLEVRSKASGSCGLSPPTRGSPLCVSFQLKGERSIPAHAGEPSVFWWTKHRKGVYPRPRGGAQHGDHDLLPPEGLSPPTRGSPLRWRVSRTFPRSIPAHAGEPRTSARTGRRPGVYPRPRGGATARRLVSMCM